jgi:nicotinamide phosphoribosyltransferase
VYRTNIMLLTDGYKLDHRRQYPDGTQVVYANFTPRDSRTGADKVVLFGLQYFLKHYMEDYANETFFYKPKGIVLDEYKKCLDNYLGPTDIGTEHIAALHDYGRMPLEFYALPEGTQVPIRVPMFTIENTHHDFFWLTNYFETLMSSVLWLPCTSATTALQYRTIFNQYAKQTGTATQFVPFQGHDFSFRGMSSPESAIVSGAAHMLSFEGTDTVPALPFLENFYLLNKFGPNGIPATEHSVMCAGGHETEIETFRRLLKLYPTGILSVVSDTWDLWNVIGTLLPQLKGEILGRNGKLVIRPDSGDPVKIICGDPDATNPLAKKGVVQALWDIFGGYMTPAGYKILNSHVGAIYGDSITLARADQICQLLAAKGFASGNVVFGIGSYTYQYVTRDTYGFAVKATWALINDEEHMLSKSPVTDNGMKFSAKGRVVVYKDIYHRLLLLDNISLDQQEGHYGINELKKVWSDGKFYKIYTFEDVKQNLKSS